MCTFSVQSAIDMNNKMPEAAHFFKSMTAFFKESLKKMKEVWKEIKKLLDVKKQTIL